MDLNFGSMVHGEHKVILHFIFYSKWFYMVYSRFIDKLVANNKQRDKPQRILCKQED